MSTNNTGISPRVRMLFFLVVIAYGGLAFFERFLWANSSYYPGILVRGKLANYSLSTQLVLRQSCSDPLEIKENSDGLFIRCGQLWPFVSVWFVNKDLLDKSRLRELHKGAKRSQ